MTYSQMRWAVAANTGIHVFSSELSQPYLGFYDEDDQSIAIGLGLSYTQKRCTLVHELMHWKHGDACCTGCVGDRCEYRARRDTALFLINEDDYATVEELYEGNTFSMASELNVTLGVLDDYRMLLHENLSC